MFRQKSKNCGGCRFWSEMCAQSLGCGPIEALCLSDNSPSCGKFVTETHKCDAWKDSLGYAIDAPGIESDYHKQIETEEMVLSEAVAMVSDD